MHEQQDGFLVSDDKTKLDFEFLYGFLSGESYWAKGITRSRLLCALDHSLCYGLYRDGRQLGFARVITDCASFAYLCDVFIAAPHRGQGLARFMLSAIQRATEFEGVRRWLLATRDAHGLYEKLGFEPADPGRFMEIVRPYSLT